MTLAPSNGAAEDFDENGCLTTLEVYDLVVARQPAQLQNYKNCFLEMLTSPM